MGPIPRVPAFAIATACAFLLVAGCLTPTQIGGEKIISGYASMGRGFENTGDENGSRGPFGVLYLSTDEVNRDGVESPDCLFRVDLLVYRDEHPDAYRRIAAVADEDGDFRGIFIQFRGVTTYWILHHEDTYLVELVKVLPAPAGHDWWEAQCPEDASRRQGALS